MTNQTPPQKPLTVQEAKDVYAKKHGYKDWNDFFSRRSIHPINSADMESVDESIEDIATLYHTSQSEKETDAVENAFEAARKRISHPDFDYVYETFQDYIKETQIKK